MIKEMMYGADEVRTRVSGATSDLHAADSEYHDDSYKSFCSERNVKAAQSKESSATKETKDTAFKHVIKVIPEDPKHVWRYIIYIKVHLKTCLLTLIYQGQIS